MSRALKVLYVSARLPSPFWISGAELANFALLRFWQTQGHQVDCIASLGTLQLDNSQRYLKKFFGLESEIRDGGLIYGYGGVQVTAVRSQDFLPTYRRRRAAMEPDWIFLRDNSHNVDCAELVTNDGRYFTYLQSEDAHGVLEPIKDRLDLIVTNSRFARRKTLDAWGRDSAVVLPVPERHGVLAPESARPGDAVTMINPSPVKGDRMLLHLAERFPESQFMAVRSWNIPRHREIEAMANIREHRKTLDMPGIYGQTRILLVPAQWDEYFGRTPIEAAFNGIPSLVSGVGGLREHFRGNGVLVHDYADPAAWETAFRQLQDPERYAEAVANCRRVADEFSFEQEAGVFEQLLKDGA